MRQNSEFPLFLQTVVAIFGFLLLIAFLSSLTAPKAGFQRSSAEPIESILNGSEAFV